MSHSIFAPSYEDRCRQHATNQGLDPICVRLKRHGFKPQLLQTGGFTMVVEAFYNQSIQILVTYEGSGPQGDTRPYLVGVYPRVTDAQQADEHGDDWLAYQYVSLQELPASITKFSQQEAW